MMWFNPRICMCLHIAQLPQRRQGGEGGLT